MIYLRKIIIDLRMMTDRKDWTKGTGLHEGAEGEMPSQASFIKWKEELLCSGIAVEGANNSGEEVPTLWITDSGEAAREYLAEGRAVLALLHDGNSGEDFSAVKYACQDLTELDAAYLDRVFRRYHGISWDILSTDRCFLRETKVEDVEAFYEIYKDPSITEYMEDLFEDPDQEIAYTEDYIRNVYEFYGFGVWTVCLKETGQVIGRAGLSYREGFEDPELGFMIGRSWQRRGLAREICEAILDFGRKELEFEKVIAFAETENRVSCHLLEKLGFVIEGEETLLGRRHLLWAKTCD